MWWNRCVKLDEDGDGYSSDSRGFSLGTLTPKPVKHHVGTYQLFSRFSPPFALSSTSPLPLCRFSSPYYPGTFAAVFSISLPHPILSCLPFLPRSSFLPRLTDKTIAQRPTPNCITPSPMNSDCSAELPIPSAESTIYQEQ